MGWRQQGTSQTGIGGGEGLAGEGPNQCPPKDADDSYFGCLLLPEHGY